MEKVKFGIVGVGNQGTKYAKMLVSGEIIGATLSAVCDTNPEKLASLSDRIGGGEAARQFIYPSTRTYTSTSLTKDA